MGYHCKYNISSVLSYGHNTSRRQAARRFVSYGVVLTDDYMKQLRHMVLFKRFLRNFGKAGRNETLRNQKLPPSQAPHTKPTAAIVVAAREDVPIGVGVEVIRVVAIVNHRRPEATVVATVF